MRVLLHVGVANVKIAAIGAREGNSGLLLLEVDIAFILDNSAGLVQRLRETRALSEGVRAGGSAHVGVLTLESLGVNGDGTRLSVVAARHACTQLIIGGLCSTTVHTSLNDELVIALNHWHKLAILCPHNLPSDCVLLDVLLIEVLGISGIKVTLLGLSLDSICPLAHLFIYRVLDFALHALVFAAHTSHALSGALTGAILSVVGVHDLLVGLAVNAMVSVVKQLACDGVLEVVVSLGDVRLRNGPDRR